MRLCLAIAIVAFLMVVVVSGFIDNSQGASTQLTWGQMARVRGAATCADGCVTITHGLCQKPDDPACVWCYYSSSKQAVIDKPCPEKFKQYAGTPGNVAQGAPGNGWLQVTGTMTCSIQYLCVDDDGVLDDHRCDSNGDCTPLNGLNRYCRKCRRGDPTGFSESVQNDACIKCPT